MTTIDPQAAFIERLDRHRGILFKVASAYCRRASDREDLVAETIAQLWRSYDRFDDRLPFSTWMYRIAVNVAISFYRSESRRRRSVVPAEERVLEELAVPQPAEEDERLARVRDLIDRLNELNRALMLLYLDDRPHSEIAAILGISETNVATKISRIRDRFKRSLADEGTR